MRGLRPVRAARSLTSNVPKPTNCTLSPEDSALVTEAEKVFKAASACLLLRLIKKALDEDLIAEPFRFDDLRAVAVTNAYEKMGLQAASDVAGHTGTALTKRVYVRSTQLRRMAPRTGLEPVTQ